MEEHGPRVGNGDLTVSVRLISPAQDLANFPDLADLPVSTTVGQIKLLIGNELAFRNRSPAGMRVIYRGRLLDMDEKTLADVFGIPTIQMTRLQVLHLVLRDGTASAIAGAAPVPNPPARNPFAPQQQAAPAAHPDHFQYQAFRSYEPPAYAHQQPGSTHVFDHLFDHEAQYNQHFISQPPLGVRSQLQPMGQPSSGSLVTDVMRDLASRGQRLEEWQMQRLLLLEQQQERLRAAEARAHPTEAISNLSHRHRAAPQADPQQPPARTTTTTTGSSPFSRPNQPAIYILESPNGPRAVLIGSSTSPFQNSSVQSPAVAAAGQENYNMYMDLIQQHNLRIQQQRQNYEALLRQNMQNVEMLQQLQQLHLQRNQMHDQHIAAQRRAEQGHADPAAAAAGVDQQQQVPNVNVNRLQVNNPGAGFVAAMWPHIWLVTRLVLFVWWFTNPAASWTRWTMVILVATTIFVFNTGVLDGFAEQIWTPVRAHLDGLVNPNANNQQGAQNGAAPAGDANGTANGVNGDAAEPPPVGRAGGPEPDPAEVAARLVARRQINNGQRLHEFARRLERIGIMFLASLAPGIAERHVAIAEEREREERRRIQEAAEAAIAAEAEAQAQAEAAAAAAAAAAAGGDTKTADNDGAAAVPNAPEQVNPEDDIAAVNAQWHSEQLWQEERNAAAGLQ
ncbi:hypothetical protein Sste5346_002524 [Sporothrix stenoceras]|uniref:Ubiquitin-like domain-containing protein n=1 Tax=Sporothrix stenoceras TaxID=5173 RepID=A0ABR3ZL18_9PEZI